MLRIGCPSPNGPQWGRVSEAHAGRAFDQHHAVLAEAAFVGGADGVELAALGGGAGEDQHHRLGRLAHEDAGGATPLAIDVGDRQAVREAR